MAQSWRRHIGGEEFVPIGIRNDSGTCYINVALQCLFAMKNVRERYGNRDQVPDILCPNTHYIWFLLTGRDSRMSPDTSPTLPAHFLQKELFNGEQSGLVDDALLKIVKILDVETELKLQLGPRMIPPLMDDFIFSFQTKVICCGIDHRLPARDNNILEMNLPRDVTVGDPQLKGKWLRLEDLLKYMELEKMKAYLNKASMRCQKCEWPLIDGVPNGSNTKKVEISIEKLPQVLLISWPTLSEEDPESLAHIHNQVMFEERISLIEFASKNVRDIGEYEYRLIAVADYHPPCGIHEQVGHTTAFVSGSKYKRDGWIQFDDHEIKIIQPQELPVAHWVSVYEKVNKPATPTQRRKRQSSKCSCL